MAGVEVLHPHDPLKSGFNYHRPPVKSNESSVSRPGFSKSCGRKRSPQKNSSSGTTRSGGVASLSSSPPAKNGRLVMGHVQILKRGEVLKDTTSLQKNDKNSNEENEKVNTSAEAGSTPKQFKIAERYAGSAFFTSPPPSSLPVPAFFMKKAVPLGKNDDATNDLRRILKLDL